MEPDRQALETLVRKIVEAANPLRILLFGSAARGEMTSGSDLDLLVVMPEGVHRRRTAQQLYREVKGVGIPFDILVATPRDLEQHRDSIGLVYRAALQDAKELYAA